MLGVNAVKAAPKSTGHASEHAMVAPGGRRVAHFSLEIKYRRAQVLERLLEIGLVVGSDGLGGRCACGKPAGQQHGVLDEPSLRTLKRGQISPPGRQAVGRGPSNGSLDGPGEVLTHLRERPIVALRFAGCCQVGGVIRDPMNRTTRITRYLILWWLRTRVPVKKVEFSSLCRRHGFRKVYIPPGHLGSVLSSIYFAMEAPSDSNILLEPSNSAWNWGAALPFSATFGRFA